MNQVGFEDSKGGMVYASSLFLCRINAFRSSLFRGLSYLVTGARRVASRVIGFIAVSDIAIRLKVINTAGPETCGIVKRIKKIIFVPACKKQRRRNKCQGTHFLARDMEFSDRKIKIGSRAIVNSL